MQAAVDVPLSVRPAVGQFLKSPYRKRQESLARGVTYLLAMQEPDGSWWDFWLPVGASDAWVTAYIALALLEATTSPLLPKPVRIRARQAAERAAAWLARQCTPARPGWGYNASAPLDADSTAHVISLLARLGLQVPAAALHTLHSHIGVDGGYRTYRHPSNWSAPAADITAATLRALHDAGELDAAALRGQWAALLQDQQDADGWWQGYWWLSPGYATALVLDLWMRAGRPALARPVDPALPHVNAFDLAWTVRIAQTLGWEMADPLAALLQLQAHDGGWPAAAILRVPPERVDAPAVTLPARDARRLFVTATAVFALSQVTSDVLHSSSRVVQHHRTGRATSGARTDAQLAAVVARLGFAPADAALAAQVWATLTAESFAEPAPWPAEQLSALSGGVPLEFSATVGPGAPPALRTATEVGNPYLPPYARACSGVQAVARAAAHLGYAASWGRIRPAVDVLVRPELADPTARRFWVWGGLDHAALPSAPPALKIYLNLLHTVDGGPGAHTARQRLEQALAAAQMPLSPAAHAVLDALDAVGFLHEAGFGFTRDKLACKVYYELHGWRPALVQQVLTLAGLGQQPVDALRPAIPGLLPETLAVKQRAGIALRIHPVSGEISEVTTAMAYPPALLSPAETLRRTRAWLLTLGGPTLSYDAVADVLLPGWAAQPLARLHSLFTRSVSAEKQWTTIYLRPNLEDSV